MNTNDQIQILPPKIIKRADFGEKCTKSKWDLKVLSTDLDTFWPSMGPCKGPGGILNPP